MAHVDLDRSSWTGRSWAPTIAMSWFWGLGFFYSIHVSMTYGLLGFLAFAVPNAAGLALFGHLAGRDGVDTEALVARVEKNRLGLMILGQVFAVAVTLYAFHVHMLSPLLGDAAVPATTVITLVSFAMAHRLGLPGLRGLHGVYLLVGLAIVAALFVLVPGEGSGPTLVGGGLDTTFLSLMIPTLVGFALGPWCDVQQWHRVREIRRQGRSASREYAWGGILFLGLLFVNHLIAVTYGVGPSTLFRDGTSGMQDAVARAFEPGSLGAVLFVAWGCLALTSTIDSFHASTSTMLGRIVSTSVNPVLAFVPAGVAASPLPLFAVAVLLAVASAGLPMIYLMVPFATLLVPGAAGAVCDALGTRRVDDTTMNRLIAVLSMLVFIMGYQNHQSGALVAASSLIALSSVLFRQKAMMKKTEVAETVRIEAPSSNAVVASTTTLIDETIQPAVVASGHGFRDGWFEMVVVPTYDDTNSVGNVYFANYIRWIGKVRELFFAHCMPEFDLKTTRFLILTKSIEHDFRREVAEFQTVSVRIRIGDHNRKFVTLVHEILDANGDIVGKGSQKLMFVDSVHYDLLDIPRAVIVGFLPHFPKEKPGYDRLKAIAG